jgi:hypothetical protein
MARTSPAVTQLGCSTGAAPMRRLFCCRQFGRPAMAKKTKKTRKRTAAKAAKKSKSSKKKKAAAAKKGRKLAARKKSKPVANKKSTHKKIRKAPPESFAHKVEHEVEDAVTEVADIFTEAERLHQKLDPGISREPE